MASSTQTRVGDGRKSWVLALGLDLETTSFQIAMLAAEEQLDSLNALQNPALICDCIGELPGTSNILWAPFRHAFSIAQNPKLPIWGHEADRFQSDEDFDSDYFVANWKLALHESSDPAASQSLQRFQYVAKRLGNDDLDAFAENFSKTTKSLRYCNVIVLR